LCDYRRTVNRAVEVMRMLAEAGTSPGSCVPCAPRPTTRFWAGVRSGVLPGIGVRKIDFTTGPRDLAE
jgi:hypothetical protein